MDLFIIFPGWCTSENFYNEIFKNYNKVIFYDELNTDNLEKRISKENYKRLIFIGWSLGTLIILKNLYKFKVDKLILISPTLNFTRTTPKIIIKKMIKNISRNKELTLESFSSLNFYSKINFKIYFDKYKDSIISLDNDKLLKGLELLLNENIEDKEIKFNKKVLFVLSENDGIINIENSNYVMDKFLDKELIKFNDCGHNILFEKQEEVLKILGSYINDK